MHFFHTWTCLVIVENHVRNKDIKQKWQTTKDYNYVFEEKAWRVQTSNIDAIFEFDIIF